MLSSDCHERSIDVYMRDLDSDWDGGVLGVDGMDPSLLRTIP
jgi:hypothetical protein